MNFFSNISVWVKIRSHCELASHLHFTPSQPSYGYFGWEKLMDRLSYSTVRKYSKPYLRISRITHVTPFHIYGKHSTGPSTYGPWVRTYSKLFSCKSVLTVCSYRAQSNEIYTYGWVSHGSLPRVHRYGLLYLRTVEYDHCGCWLFAHDLFAYLYFPCCHRITTLNEYFNEQDFRQYWIITQ